MQHHTLRIKSYPILLKRPNSNSPTGLFLRTSFNGKPFKYGLGVSIFPKLWDKKTYRPITKRSEVNKFRKYDPHIDVNLKNIELTIVQAEGIIAQYILSTKKDNRAFDVNELRQALDEGIKNVIDTSDQQDQSIFVLEYLNRTKEQMKTGEIVINAGKKKGQRYSQAAIKNYSNLYNHWLSFEKQIGRKIRFDDITGDLYNQLLQYFHGKALSANTTGRYIKALKAIMTRAYDDGIHSNNVHTHKIFYAPQVQTTAIYLTPAEIEALRKEDLSSKPHYQKALDVFLVGIYTAMRYSDYSRIKPQNIKERPDGTKVIDMITKKTGERVVVPIKPELNQILSKYDYKLPKTYEQKVSKYMKEIAEAAKINSPIEVEEIKGGLKVNSTKPKYQMISSHTARRTGVCLMYLAGVSVNDIMKITGHRTEKSFKKYLIISKDEAANKMAQMDYFKGDNQNLKVV